MIEGLIRLPFARWEDERGWLGELARTSTLPKPIRQVYMPGSHPHGYEALTDALAGYFVTEEYDAADPDEHHVPWNDSRVRHLWSVEAPIVSARDTP